MNLYYGMLKNGLKPRKKKFRCVICGKWFIEAHIHPNKCKECMREHELKSRNKGGLGSGQS